MQIAKRARAFVRAALKSYGPSNIKKKLWDEEFSGGKWDFIDHTSGDCVYGPLEKYAAKGSILDLGCGPGNTANEIAADAYRNYVGLDISEAALAKARRRTEANGRAAKNTFVQSDFISYKPAQEFDVILFRESMYHVPLGKIQAILDRYSEYLTDRGVFIVRMDTASASGETKHRPTAMVDIMEAGFDVVEKAEFGRMASTVMVFRPKSRRPKESPALSR